MCGRFSLAAQLDELAGELSLITLPPEFEPSDQFHPGGAVPILTDALKRALDFYYWGLVPSWAKDVSIARKTFNARAETIMERPAFRNAFRRRRALIPATSYFEWSAVSGRKIPYRFSLVDQPIFTFGAIWEYWMDANGNEVYSAAIITTEPNQAAARYHSRMPVIIDRDDRDLWLMSDDIAAASRLMKPVASNRLRIETADFQWGDRLF